MHIAVWKKVVFSLCALFATGWVLYLAYIVFSGHFIYTFTDIALLCFAVYAPLFLGILFLSRCEKQALQKIWKLALYICLAFHCMLLYGLLFRNYYIDVAGTASGTALSHLIYQLFLLVPLALNLLLLYAQFRRPLVYWGCMIAISGLIEFLQFIMRTGYCNIDDILLSMLGCFLLYISWRSLQNGKW